MAITVTHAFTSAVADGPDSSLVRPSDWNANHVVTGACEAVSSGQTKTVGPTGDFSTLAAGLEWAGSQIGSTVTLSVQDGQYTLPSTVSVYGPSHIIIAAANAPKTVTVLSEQSRTGSAGAYSITLNVDDVTGISVGDLWVAYDLTAGAGTYGRQFGGACEITAIDSVNKRITFNSPTRFTTFGTSITGTGYVPKVTFINTANDITFQCFRARLQFSNISIAQKTSGTNAFVVYAAGQSVVEFGGTAVGLLSTSTGANGIPVLGRQASFISVGGASILGINNYGGGAAIDIAERTTMVGAGKIITVGGSGRALLVYPASVFYSPTNGYFSMVGAATSSFTLEFGFIKMQGMTATNGIYNMCVTPALAPTATTVVGFTDIA